MFSRVSISQTCSIEYKVGSGFLNSTKTMDFTVEFLQYTTLLRVVHIKYYSVDVVL